MINGLTSQRLCSFNRLLVACCVMTITICILCTSCIISRLSFLLLLCETGVLLYGVILERTDLNV